MTHLSENVQVGGYPGIGLRMVATYFNVHNTQPRTDTAKDAATAQLAPEANRCPDLRMRPEEIGPVRLTQLPLPACEPGRAGVPNGNTQSPSPPTNPNTS